MSATASQVGSSLDSEAAREALYDAMAPELKGQRVELVNYAPAKLCISISLQQTHGKLAGNATHFSKSIAKLLEEKHISPLSYSECGNYTFNPLQIFVISGGTLSLEFNCHHKALSGEALQAFNLITDNMAQIVATSKHNAVAEALEFRLKKLHISHGDIEFKDGKYEIPTTNYVASEAPSRQWFQAMGAALEKRAGLFPHTEGDHLSCAFRTQKDSNAANLLGTNKQVVLRISPELAEKMALSHHETLSKDLAAAAEEARATTRLR